MRKQIVALVYTPGGTFIRTWEAFRFDGFVKEINGGLAECNIGLPKQFDYTGPDVLEGRHVELRVSDGDTATLPGIDASRVIYRGYVSSVERNIEGGSKEGVTVRLLGHYTRLSLDILKDGTQTTLYSKATDGLTIVSGDQSAADIGDMVRAIIDRYGAETTTPQIRCNPSDIPDTGTTATFRFEQKTYREALDDCLQLAPAGTFYYVDENGLLTFGQKPTSPTHRFTFGKDFQSVRVSSSMESLRNFALVWNGDNGSPIYEHYQDDNSIALYGRRAATLTNFGIDSSNAADLIGAKFIAENSAPEVKVQATIIDNNNDASLGYDIESIQPGDTCALNGFNSDLAVTFRDNMLITRVSYELDRATIDVEVIKSTIVDFQNRQGRAIGDIQSGGLGVPPNYA